MKKATMEYRCLHSQQFDDSLYSLVPLRHQDIQSIREWRNAQMEVLRQNAPITELEQEAYYRNVVSETFHAEHPEQILFSYLMRGKCIGYGALVRIDWKRKQAEISFLVDPMRAKDEEIYRNDFSRFLGLLKTVAFEDLGLERLYAETYDIRPLHISILESEGFAFEERLKGRVMKDGKMLDALIHGCYP